MSSIERIREYAVLTIVAVALGAALVVFVTSIQGDDPVVQENHAEGDFQEFAVPYMNGTLHCIERVLDTTRVGFSCDFDRFHTDNG